MTDEQIILLQNKLDEYEKKYEDLKHESDGMIKLLKENHDKIVSRRSRRKECDLEEENKIKFCEAKLTSGAKKGQSCTNKVHEDYNVCRRHLPKVLTITNVKQEEKTEETEETKACAKCKTDVPISGFRPKRTDCKQCEKKLRDDMVITVEQRRKKQGLTQKTCNKCKKQLEISNFTLYSRNKDGYNSKCKECFAMTREQNKKWIKCTQCDKEYLRKDDLNRHVLENHKE